jgi:hypothetical protein
MRVPAVFVVRLLVLKIAANAAAKAFHRLDTLDRKRVAVEPTATIWVPPWRIV